MKKIIILTVAIALDLIFGEPSNRFHPVAWIGKLISLFDRLNPGRQGRRGTMSGFRIWAAVVAITAEAIFFLNWRLNKLPFWLRILPSAWLLKTTFSLKGLWQSAGKVEDGLSSDNIEGARDGLKALVSRDVAELDESRLAAAAVESVAENTSDSFIAPAFYYSLFGLPGAFIYRAINTLDSMLGYHGEYEYVGKAAAKLDDVANLVPARLTGYLIAFGAQFKGLSGKNSLEVMRRDARLTESPNAGYPMSAMAGALEVELEKTGHYRLGSPASSPDSRSIKKAIELSKLSAFLILPLLIFIEVLKFARKT